jgi:hypothetical protein
MPRLTTPKQVLLAAEVLVKTSVSQAGVSHNGGNRGARDAFGTNTPGGVFQNLPMNFGFVPLLVTDD